MQEKCCANGCNRPIKYKKHKLCQTHYMRYRNHGCVLSDIPIKAWNTIRPYRGDVKDKANLTG